MARNLIIIAILAISLFINGMLIKSVITLKSELRASYEVQKNLIELQKQNEKTNDKIAEAKTKTNNDLQGFIDVVESLFNK